MSYFQNLREFLGKLEELGRLRRITTPVDKDRELHPLVKWQYRGLEESSDLGLFLTMSWIAMDDAMTDTWRPP
jgi:4-hydroxy-3-polyprenylbenzoate decarboxylase